MGAADGRDDIHSTIPRYGDIVFLFYHNARLREVDRGHCFCR